MTRQETKMLLDYDFDKVKKHGPAMRAWVNNPHSRVEYFAAGKWHDPAYGDPGWTAQDTYRVVESCSECGHMTKVLYTEHRYV